MSGKQTDQAFDDVREAIAQSAIHAQTVYLLLLAFCAFAVASMGRHYDWIVDNTSKVRSYRSLQPQVVQELLALRVLAANPNMNDDRAAKMDLADGVRTEVKGILGKMRREKPEVPATWLSGRIADQERRVADISRWQVDAIREQPQVRMEPLGDVALPSVGLWAPIIILAVFGYLGALCVQIELRVRALHVVWPKGRACVTDTLPTNLVTMALVGSSRLKLMASAAVWGVGPLALLAMAALAVASTATRLTLRPTQAGVALGPDAIVIIACLVVSIGVLFLSQRAISERSVGSRTPADTAQEPQQEATSAQGAASEPQAGHSEPKA